MKQFACTVLLFFTSIAVFGQMLTPEIMSCFGGYSKNSTIQLTWTAGEPLYETISNTNSILTQGFNQTVYITTITGTKEMEGYSIAIYPNPTESLINIKLDKSHFELLTILIFDIKGTKIFSRITSNSQEQIDISKFPSGTYLLNITDNKNLIRSFKIQKIK